MLVTFLLSCWRLPRNYGRTQRDDNDSVDKDDDDDDYDDHDDLNAVQTKAAGEEICPRGGQQAQQELDVKFIQKRSRAKPEKWDDDNEKEYDDGVWVVSAVGQKESCQLQHRRLRKS